MSAAPKDLHGSKLVSVKRCLKIFWPRLWPRVGSKSLIGLCYIPLACYPLLMIWLFYSILNMHHSSSFVLVLHAAHLGYGVGWWPYIHFINKIKALR